MLDGARILITGGTGSLGHCLVQRILDGYSPARLVVFSRDELKQYQMQERFQGHDNLRYFLGDVRDRDRLRRAFQGIDVVIHAAALKQVPAAEYNPMEFVKTNVLGAENVIEAAIDAGVKKVVALSSDKACAPINLYGATKLCSDKLFASANSYAGPAKYCFTVVRYGNVMGSRGSVIPFYLEKRKTGILPITDTRMTRFNITLNQGVDLVLKALFDGFGGEIFVPKIPSYRITDLAEAIGPDCDHKIVGIRPGEKVHEEMISHADALTTMDLGECFTILPSANTRLMEKYESMKGASLVPEGFCYNSGTNPDFLSVEEIRTLIRDHVDSSFEVAGK